MKISIKVTNDNGIEDEIAKDLKVEIPSSFFEDRPEPVEPKKWTPGPHRKKGPLIVDTENEDVIIGNKIEDTSVRLDTVATPATYIIF